MRIKNILLRIATLSAALTLTSPLAQAQSISDITDLILVTGQSNVTGSLTAYDPSLDSIDLRVFAYTDSDDWEVADLHQAWDVDGWHPGNGSLADSSRTPYNNFAFHFAKTIVENDPDRVVGFIIASAPGEGIKHWDANSRFSQTIESKVLAALSAQGVKSTIDGIIWHQGETDWQFNGTSDVDATDAERSDPTYYPTKLNALINRYRNESWFDANKPFICGETKQAPVNGRLMALNSDNDPWTACVAASDLSTREQDLQANPPVLGTHFDGASLRTLGQRYAAKYLEMTDDVVLPKTPTIKVMAVGDSITEGVLGQKSYRNELIPLLTQSECTFEMVGSKSNNETITGFQSPHEGYSGHTANRFIDGDSANPGIDVMMTQSPDVVLLHLGSNDMRLAQSVSGTVDEIDQIVTKIWNNNPQTEVFVANVIPWFGASSTNATVQADVELLGTAIEQWANNKNDPQLHLVDVRTQFSPGMMISDLVHPNATGEAHIADAFYDRLTAVLGCSEQTIDLIAPETFITVPAVGGTVNETTNFRGTAIDTGGSGFEKVWVAIRDEHSNQWYNFTDDTFGAISKGGVDVGITNANLSNTTVTSTNWNITATLPAGDYRLFALAIDNAGNDAFHGTGLAVWPVNRNFQVESESTDTTKPTADITSPTDGSSFSPTIVSVTGTASDADSGVNRVLVRVQRLDVSPRLYWNGTAWTPTSIYPDTILNTDATSWTLPDVDLTNSGDYRIHVIAFDNTGNIAGAAVNPSTNFSIGTIDTIKPIAEATSHPNGITLSPDTASISGTAFDADSGVNRVLVRIQRLDASPRLYWNGTAWTPNSSYPEATLNSSATSWTLPSVDLTESGEYRIHIIAYDNAGNFARAADNPNSNFTVNSADTTKPIAETTSHSDGSTISSQIVDVTGTAADVDSGVNRVLVRVQRIDISPRLYWNGTAWTPNSSYPEATLNSSASSWTLPSVDLTESGDYRIHVIAYDNAGNFARAADNPSTNFAVANADTTMPIAEATIPAHATSISPSTTNISGIASDSGSGVYRVLVRVQQSSAVPVLYWNGTQWTSNSTFVEASVNQNGTNWTLPNVDLNSIGNYRIRLRVFDNAGNRANPLDNPNTDFNVEL